MNITCQRYVFYREQQACRMWKQNEIIIFPDKVRKDMLQYSYLYSNSISCISISTGIWIKSVVICAFVLCMPKVYLYAILIKQIIFYSGDEDLAVVSSRWNLWLRKLILCYHSQRMWCLKIWEVISWSVSPESEDRFIELCLPDLINFYLDR